MNGRTKLGGLNVIIYKKCTGGGSSSVDLLLTRMNLLWR